jgi:hypothetical protein
MISLFDEIFFPITDNHIPGHQIYYISSYRKYISDRAWKNLLLPASLLLQISSLAAASSVSDRAFANASGLKRLNQCKTVHTSRVQKQNCSTGSNPSLVGAECSVETILQLHILVGAEFSSAAPNFFLAATESHSPHLFFSA